MNQALYAHMNNKRKMKKKKKRRAMWFKMQNHINLHAGIGQRWLALGMVSKVHLPLITWAALC
jgi:hypothetical protein